MPSREELLQLRDFDGDKNVNDFAINTVRDSLIGASIVRSLQAIAKNMLMVEQWISCTLATHNGGWAAVVWLDTGRPLPASLIRRHASNRAEKSLDQLDVTIVPIIQPTAKAALAGLSSPPPTSAYAGLEARDQAQCFERNKQSTAHLPTSQYGTALDLPNMYASPLYAISDVIRHSACSSNQWVNMMHENIRSIMRVEGAYASKSEAEALEDLQYAKSLVDDHATYLWDVVAFMESGCPAWVHPWQHLPLLPPSSRGANNQRGGRKQPGNKEGEGEAAAAAAATADMVKAELLKDFRYLLHRLDKLSANCRESAELLLSRAQLRESTGAIAKADEMGKLTLLVFIFAPLSFLSSIFGMNFVNLKPKVGLAIYLSSACILVLVMTLLARKSVREQARKQWKKLVD